jgi:hypothetical protein
MSAKGVHITYTTVGEGFLALGSSTIALDDVTVDGANVAGSIGVNAASGCTVRVGKNVHMDAAAGPTFNFNGGSHWNRSAIGPGPVTLTGTADVVIAWPDLQSSDDVLVELVTPTGTVGPVKVTKTPGTGFRLTGTNVADTSAVNYVVL